MTPLNSRLIPPILFNHLDEFPDFHTWKEPG
jgi:hypothetical protein